MAKDLTFTRSQLETVCRQCTKNVKALLASVNSLLTKKTTRKYALGLYMYAVEEYGKACLLKQDLKERKEEYSIPKWIFGGGEREAHSKKIKAGFDHLPSECTILAFSPYIEIRINTSSTVQTVTLTNGKVVSVLPFTTGLFQDSDSGKGKTKTRSMYIDFDYKNRCFYVDPDPNRNEEINNLSINKNTMKTNLNLFKDKIKEF